MLLLAQKLSCMQQREPHGDHCKKGVQDFEARRVLALRRSAAVESLKPLHVCGRDCKSRIGLQTSTDDDILDPETRRVDGSIQLVRWLQAAYSRSRCSVSNCSALLTESWSLIV